MSFEPIEKPSKYCRNCSASSALDGISHIMITRSPLPPRRSPCSASRSTTCLASVTVRTNGTMISTLVSPMSSRTRLSAVHSSSKHSLKLGSMKREAPRKPSIGFSSWGS